MALRNTPLANRGLVAPVPEPTRGLGRYVLLLVVQTAGAAIVLVNGLPIYRQLTRDFGNHKPQPGVLWWAIGAAAMIQAAYWPGRRLCPPRPPKGQAAASHL